jgi:predicted RNase H-like HicB family nuclease
LIPFPLKFYICKGISAIIFVSHIFQQGISKMETIKFVYYQEDDMWVGWLEDYPDYRTQGATIEELKENLKDIFQDIHGGKIPQVRRIGELTVG